MKKNFVLIKGKKCRLFFGRYPNGTLAIEAEYRNRPFLTCSVNWESNWQGFAAYKNSFPFPMVVLKNYSENEGIIEELEAAGVIENGGAYLAGTNRTVQARKLTEAWQVIANKFLTLTNS